MRGLVAAAAVAGALVLGGLPTAALVLTADDAGTADRAAVDATTGPPSWANGRARGHEKERGRHHQGRSPHGWAVREWAHCLAGAAREERGGTGERSRASCGAKPQSPGLSPRRPRE